MTEVAPKARVRGRGRCAAPSGNAPSSRPSPRTRGEGVRTRRENEFALRHCERQRSNPGRLARKLDCFVAVAPRNDENRRKGCVGCASYLRRRAGGIPINASKAIAKAASSPRASAPPLAASTRLPIPASFGSFENPATQPVAASRLSKSSASQRSAPLSKHKDRPDRAIGAERRRWSKHRFAGDRAAVVEQNTAGGIAHDDRVAIAPERTTKTFWIKTFWTKPFRIVMRNPVGQDRAAACSQRDLGGAGDFGAGEEHQRIGGQRQEGMVVDLKARVCSIGKR